MLKQAESKLQPHTGGPPLSNARLAVQKRLIGYGVMHMIDSLDQARRLALAIIDDIRSYHANKLHAARTEGISVLADEITEGRTLFQGRVVSALHDVFEVAVANLAAVGGRLDDSAPSPTAGTVWAIVMEQIHKWEHAAALMQLFECGDDELAANGEPISGLLQSYYATERAMADFLADQLNRVDDNGWEYSHFYRCTRDRDATTQDIAAFVQSCRTAGIELSYLPKKST